MRASFNVLGPLLARCGEARVALPGRRQHRQPQGRHAPARARGDGRRGRGRARLRRTRAPSCCTARASCSSSRASARPRTSCARRCSPRARPSSRTRRASPRSPTSPRSSTAWARTSLGAGTSTIEIEGVEELHAGRQRDHGDRVEAGTLLMACGIAGGEIELVGVRPEHLEIVVDEAVRDGHARLADERRPVGAGAAAAARGRHRDAAASRVSPPTSCRSRSR